MSRIVTFDELRRRGKATGRTAGQIISEHSRSLTTKDTFLSYSSRDVEFVPAVIDLLEQHGASVYCDKGDDSLPEKPNLDTARILRNAISSCERLVVFVTTNSNQSRWIPWELGFGDGVLNDGMVAILPAAQSEFDSKWVDQEYLGLYRRIEHGRLNSSGPRWLVADDHDNTAILLEDWCAQDRGRR